ncbi:D-2-hydroxyacid dehydrogenase [Bacillus suaedae]|uniref:D-2-hydroxyacid dehydrogenase n=1 Tax=Halalkalibacter suaedae TaxID=2822140 RepID=A0A940WR73_9BACI|nr:D-2-hydroxyacid dehydrogenase [Bacillus suaedae]MBP3951020.1 D-2-hydroxyacid dehydrogenase [Bacillus suaedae]
MPTHTIIIAHDIHNNYKQQIKELVPNWDVIIGKEQSHWENHLKNAEVILGWKSEMRNQLHQLSCLKWLQTWSAGVNNLPLKHFEDKDLIITSANGVHANPISETIFGLMLSLTRKINTYVLQQKQKQWHHANMNLEIHGKTIGIIGVGEIGKETAKIAKAFGMKVVGMRHSGKPEANVDEMYTPNQLDQLLPKCDYVVVTLPLTTNTVEMFKAKQFQMMKPSAFFINIGRGEIVNEPDLINALQEGTIAGAGLDVFEQEPLPVSSPLWEFENVIITPHTSGSTEHYTKRVIEDIFIPNLKMYVGGNTPTINLVDYNKGY